MLFFTASFLICALLAVALKKFMSKTALATIKERPMLLGVSVYVCVLLVCLFALAVSGEAQPFAARLLVVSFLMLAFGILDDIKKLSVNIKLLGQVAVAFIAVMLGMHTTIYYFPVWLNRLVTIIWIVALVNAFNFLDIMDGLCTGISFIVSLGFLLTVLATGAGFMNVFFCVLAGATLAALVFNFPPAKLYLGDSGSMTLGLVFACSALEISYAPDFDRGLSLFVPALIVALPLYDLVFTVLRRVCKGISIAQKSRDHLVLILTNAGLGTKKILAVMYGICALFCVGALLLQTVSAPFKILFMTGLLGAVFLLTIAVRAVEFRKRSWKKP